MRLLAFKQLEQKQELGFSAARTLCCCCCMWISDWHELSMEVAWSTSPPRRSPLPRVDVDIGEINYALHRSNTVAQDARTDVSRTHIHVYLSWQLGPSEPQVNPAPSTKCRREDGRVADLTSPENIKSDVAPQQHSS